MNNVEKVIPALHLFLIKSKVTFHETEKQDI